MNTVTGVKLLAKAVAVLLLALWLPATLHCRLESLPSFSFLACSDDEAVPHQDDQCQQDSCGAVETGFYKVEDEASLKTTPPDAFAPVALCRLTAISLAPQSLLRRAALAPPDLPAAWQFFLRAALPARAPDFAS